MFINIERPNDFSASRSNNRKSFTPPMAKGDGEWLSTHTAHGDNYSPILKGYNVTVNLWCMNPAVVTFLSCMQTSRQLFLQSFLDAFSESWSVVLASGTLCPTETFQSELGVDFKMRMEGDQVIPKEQIFASVVPAVLFECSLWPEQQLMSVFEGPERTNIARHIREHEQ
jgi:hypothetical protein